MNRTVKAITAALLTLGLAVIGLPLGGGAGGGATINVGATGCCKQ
jgi:biotin transporter BioY